jgi:spore germination cell wall hydrolase CwlJ-like protein
MSSLVIDERTALEDLLESCHGAVYAYGIVAAYLTDPDEALDAMASFRKQRDQLLATIAELGYAAPPARAAYSLKTEVIDDASARVTASLLEESIVAHWANAIFYLPIQVRQRECEFLQSAAIRSFNWAGIAKAFSSAQ